MRRILPFELEALGCFRRRHEVAILRAVTILCTTALFRENWLQSLKSCGNQSKVQTLRYKFVFSPEVLAASPDLSNLSVPIRRNSNQPADSYYIPRA